MTRHAILIVEDDRHILKLLQFHCEKAGYQTATAKSGDEGLRLVQSMRPDLVILDLMLPGLDGLEVCRQIRQDPQLKAIPVVMLTAKGEEMDRVVGLEVGADDYVTKPFSPRELLLRVKAVLRRSKGEPQPGDVLRHGPVTVDVAKHQVTVQGKPVTLTLLEFKLLATLVERRGRLQSREVLLRDVWDLRADIDTRTVDTHIKRLRQKLGKAGDLIETIRGVGYKMAEEAP